MSEKAPAAQRGLPDPEAQVIGGSTGFEPSVQRLGMGHPETVRAVLGALASVSFPVTTGQLRAAVGQRTIPVPSGEGVNSVPFSDILSSIPDATFQNASEVKDAVRARLGGFATAHEEHAFDPQAGNTGRNP